MPNPSDFNNQSDFMKSCVPKMIDEGKNQDQAVAACSNMWSGAITPTQSDPNTQPSIPSQQPTPPKSKLQLLADFKKTLEKNGFQIDDTTLEGLIQSIQAGGSGLKAFSFKADILNSDTQWIKIFPKGKFYFEKYGDTFDFNDNFFNQILDNFQSTKLFKPYIDNDHKLQEKYAEILKLEKRSDGMYAQIDLNTLGKDAIKNNVYSYISPQWGDRVDTEQKLHKNVLWAVTLTNIPAFEGTLKRLQDQIKLSKLGGTKMYDETKIYSLKAKCDTYKLQNTVDPAQLMPLVEEMLSMIDEMKKKIEEVTGQAQEAQEQNQQVQGAMASLKKEIEEKEKENFFEESLKMGKVEVAEIENFKKLYSLDKETVINTINTRSGKQDYQLASNSYTSNKLTKEDYEIMENLGIENTPEGIALYIKSQK